MLHRSTLLVLVSALAGAALLGACTSSVNGHPSALPTASISLPLSLPVPATSSVARSIAARPATRTNAQPPRPPETHAVVPLGLPLTYATGDATQVITATASSMAATSGTLQAWQRTAGGWQRVGPATQAWFGSQGLTAHMSEWISATPIGSYTLSEAFGADSNPGTGLPYFRTTPADWWIENTTGPDAKLYNTHQHCASNCPFNTSGSNNNNEHLFYETPYYNYAVVIDYNTANAPGGTRLGAGSGVFLHVTVHAPTAGCVAIDQDRLVAIMRWLSPAAHPRILIGVDGS